MFLLGLGEAKAVLSARVTQSLSFLLSFPCCGDETFYPLATDRDVIQIKPWGEIKRPLLGGELGTELPAERGLQ